MKLIVRTLLLVVTTSLCAVPSWAQSTSTGKFVFDFTINVSSTIPSTAKIVCQGTAQQLSDAYKHDEQASVTVVRCTGSTVTCTVNIPYSWVLNNAVNDDVILSYSVSTTGRQSSGSTTIPMPLNGATTTTNISPTI